jgi:hypothetical protein
LTDQPWLDRYSGETTDELLRLASRYRPDSVVLCFEEAIAAKADRVGLASLSWPERVVLAVEALEREVNSGGYVSLFAYYAEQVPDVAGALDAIGASRAREITQAAIDALAVDGPLTPAALEASIYADGSDAAAALSSLDAAYYADVGDLAEPLLDYIRANREEIVVP